MSRTYTGIFTIAGTEEECPLSLVVVGATVIQLLAAVGAVEQARKHTHDAGTIWSAAVLPEVLDESESFPVNDGGVSVGEPCVDKKDTARNRQNKI